MTKDIVKHGKKINPCDKDDSRCNFYFSDYKTEQYSQSMVYLKEKKKAICDVIVMLIVSYTLVNRIKKCSITWLLVPDLKTPKIKL